MMEMEKIKESIVQLLNDQRISGYKISKATGINETVVHYYRTGKADIDNMKLGNAIRLYQYYLSIKNDQK